MIRAWPIVEWVMPQSQEVWPRFWHVSTQVRDQPGSNGLRCGDTIWIGTLGDKSIGVAWEWSEVLPRILVLTDPNMILSNVSFVTEEGEPVDELRVHILHNRLAHYLEWQGPVLSMLAAAQQHPEIIQSADDLGITGKRSRRSARLRAA